MNGHTGRGKAAIRYPASSQISGFPAAGGPAADSGMTDR